MSDPVISVVVPTRDRKDAVQRLLSALAADTAAPAFEVIVVDDGSSDETVATLRQLCLPYPLSVVQQQGDGPAGARNAGARAARGKVLLFLDDDVQPLPGTLAAHADFHRDDEWLIGVGDLPPVVDGSSFFSIILRGWWEMMLRDIRQPGHRFGLQNLLTGHVSIRRARFDALEGFDPALRCHEDWELGYRALRAGLQMRFVPGAVARHHDATNLTNALRRKFDEGVADIELTRRHPELAHVFPYSRPLASKKARVLKRLTFVAPRFAGLAARGLERMLPLFEGVKLRFRWRQTLELLLVYHYWRGVSSIVPDRRDVSALVAANRDAPDDPFIVDLADGLDAAARRVDAKRPSSLVLMLGEDLIGTVREWPGLEPLRGAHLPALLARGLRRPYLRALARRGVIPARLAAALPALSEVSRHATHASAPLVRDEQLSTHVAARLDVEQRAAVPPVHDVA